jgi:hypothetical protein
MPDFFVVNKSARIRPVAADRQCPVRMLELNCGNPLGIRVNILRNRRQLSKTRGDFQRAGGQVNRQRSFSQLGLTKKNAGSRRVAAESDICTPKGVVDLNRVIGCEIDTF